jgi:hypothetical protein
MDTVPLRVRANAAFNRERVSPPRSDVLVAAQVLSGTFSDGILLRSDLHGDYWRVGEATVFGVGPPTEYDLNTDGKRHLRFVAAAASREIEEGEEFTQACEIPQR